MGVAFVNGRVLTDSGLEEGLTVTTGSAHIASVERNRVTRAKTVEKVDLEGRLLLPGFIDTQVNGGGGVLFNDAPTVESIEAIGRSHRRFGTTAFLPTLVSDDLHIVADALSATHDAIASKVPGILGMHIEGPFLNEDRKGVHDASKIRDLDEDAFRLLTRPTGGKTLLTLAPEKTTPRMIRKLTEAGVVVSAGHSNATYAQIRGALENGLSGFTHLFNAMSQITVREPGVVGAALDDPDSWCSIIVDGHHVDPVVLRLALHCKRRDRFVLVTDAMPSVGSAQKSFSLLGRKISVRNGVCIGDDGTLAGSNIDMATAVRNAVDLLRVGLADAVRMASAYPAEFIGLAHEFGRIAPGYRANFVVADDELNVHETWIDGSRSQAN